VSRRVGLSASDRKYPALTGRSGTQRGTSSAVVHDGGTAAAPWSSSPPSDLRITLWVWHACGTPGWPFHV